MRNVRPAPFLAACLSLTAACHADKLGDSAEGGGAYLLAEVESGEWLPGDITTNTLLLGSNAFLRPAANLSDEHESFFYSGNSWFNQDFVPAPATTDTRDGLGPLQNARSCSGCHFKDGRAAPPATPDDNQLGTLVRLSIPGTNGHGGALGDPVYGIQLQDGGYGDIPKEGRPTLEWREEPGTYDDGTPYTLRRPTLTIEELGYGDLHPSVMTSVRVAPHMIGLGLLEGIPEA
ncbi:MAG TPA: thiol oxidoreductase, partial [Deltaproteobacteria bacterium]|nr:thiol oxidoreductase [Deltaproteobacteria bacterium]